MKRIDYSYRPSSYWDHESPVAAILSRVMGQERRKLIRNELLTGSAEELPEEILRDEEHQLETLAIQEAGPAWMGGEYLPTFLAGEIEIARIVLASTTQDVYSVRARRRANGIRYRIVNEYQMTMRLGRQSSKRPLTLLELTRAIDTITTDAERVHDFTDDIRDYMTDDPEGAVDCVTVESEVYPGLDRHYHQMAMSWLARHTATSDNE